MCGIAGVLDLSGSRSRASERRDELRRMASLIAHRGPDEWGYFIDEQVAMTTVRLSVKDLEHGQQPMTDPSQRYWIVYNGEIYNDRELRHDLEQRGHRFQTRCDTEVALRAFIEWGDAAPERFDGGFALVVYDRRERTATLMRDRFGKRPLFVCQHGRSMLFASEVKAMLARQDLALRWDVRGLAGVFAKWAPCDDEAPFEGIRQLPPGTVLHVCPSGTSERTYARFPHAATTTPATFDAAQEQARALLEESVRLRLRSDVEVGVLLSGGLDSTAVAQMVRAERPGRVHAFSVTFRDARFDESQAQRRVVEAFGLTHTTIEIDGADIANSFAAALWHAEVPQFRTAFVPMYQLASLVRRQGIKVVLSGEGADEVFLGYDIFKEARLRAEWATLSPADRTARLRRMYAYLPHFNEGNTRFLEAVFGRAGARLPARLQSHALRFENARLALRLLRTDDDGLMVLGRELDRVEGFASLSSVRKAQWIEFHTLLQGYLLSSQSDRMLFAHGVEPRCPFLSPRLVDYLATLPETYLLSPADEEKRLLKQMFRNDVPAAVLQRPKQPYLAPDASSFLQADDRGRFPDWVEDLLDERALRRIEPVSVEHAMGLVRKVRTTAPANISPREDQAFVLLLSLALLDRQFIRRVDAPPRREPPPLVVGADFTAH